MLINAMELSKDTIDIFIEHLSRAELVSVQQRDTPQETLEERLEAVSKDLTIRNDTQRLLDISFINAKLKEKANAVETDAPLVEDDHRDAVDILNRLVGTFSLSDEYNALQNKIRGRLIRKLRNDPLIHIAQHHWEHLPFERQAKIIERCVEKQRKVQARVLDIDAPKRTIIVWEARPRQNFPITNTTALNLGTASNSFFDNTALMSLNIHPDTEFSERFAKAAGVATHEQTHIMQRALSKAYVKNASVELANEFQSKQNPLLLRSEELIETARLFHHISALDAYVSSQIFSAYKKQVEEQDAFGFGDALEAAMEERNPKAAWTKKRVPWWMRG